MTPTPPPPREQRPDGAERSGDDRENRGHDPVDDHHVLAIPGRDGAHVHFSVLRWGYGWCGRPRRARELLRSPAGERALDLGAGNGLGGEELRRVGVGRVFAVDLELQARQAVCRNRRGVYDDYRAGDLADLPEAKLAALAALEPTAVLALSWVIDQPMLVSSVLVDARPH